MAYNLPPPWDPGFALPDNVRDEGLERRGFVTKQMPRGTYDQPNVGTGGYAVPRYVMDEGYGQGTFTTKWEPRGQYDGGKIPYWLDDRPKVMADRRGRRGKQDLTMAFPLMVMPQNQGATALSGTSMPEPFATYGARGADMLIARISRVPQPQRLATLKGILDSVDKTLWPKVTQMVRALVAQGYSPGRALREALARALSTGIVAEVIRAGQSRTAPKPGSLLGLGCYGCASALGAVDAASLLSSSMTFSAVAAGPQEGDCSADGGYIYKRMQVAGQPAGTTALTWVRKSATDVCGRVTAVTGEVRTGQGGGVSVSEATLVDIAPGIRFPAGMRSGGAIVFDSIDKVPAETRQFVFDSWTKGPGFSSGLFSIDDQAMYQRCFKSWFEAFGFVPGQTRASLMRIFGRDYSRRFLHPLTGEDWGMKIGLAEPGKNFNDSSTSNCPFVLRIQVEKVPDKSLLSKVLNAPFKLLGTVAETGANIVRTVTDPAIKGLSDLACQLINNPGAVQGGAAAGGGAGAAGVAIAQQTACQPPPQTPPPDSGLTLGGSNLLPLALVGGAGLLAVILLGKKKSATKVTP